MHYAVFGVFPAPLISAKSSTDLKRVLKSKKLRALDGTGITLPADGWVAGGRFSGFLDGYEPELNPANSIDCPVCGGVGRRPDADEMEARMPGFIVWCNGCNGCQGSGKTLKHPADWQPHQGDVQTTEFVASRMREGKIAAPWALLLPNGPSICEPTLDDVIELLRPLQQHGVVVLDWHL